VTATAAPGLVPYEEALTEFAPVIGLETHVELGTASKMFCGCATTFGAEPNTQTCPVCLGLPGALPVVNQQAIASTVRIGLALHCTIATWCRFARKNYFYPDMPKNFQTSQYDEPLCTDGWLDVEVPGEAGQPAETVRVEIERVHLEEDTGKTLHVGGATGRIHGASHSLVDYNRAGIPLVEIVTKPVAGTGARAAAVAKAYVAELRDLLRGLDVSDVRMEQGSLRCDVNTSLSRPGEPWGTRTETKNVNSLRSVERAVRSEVERQAALLRAGQRIVQETRHFSETTGDTSPGRSKEEATDYRYFPEPDLVPVAPDPGWVEQLRAALPEPPSVRRRRMVEQLGLSDLDAQAMVNAGVLDLVLATVEAGAPPAEARNWWLGHLAQAANASGTPPDELAVTPAQVARVVALVQEGALTAGLARQVVDGVLAGEGEPDEVVAARGLAVVSDEGALGAAVDTAIAANPAVADKVRNGKVAAAGALVGAVMKATRGQADAAAVKRLVLERLGVSE
jgi:aspartyl-tRNA(Asn)/glutamyl-tRNA(Gln) amidotransferase subunit B